MNIRYRVELHQSERDELRAVLAGGQQPVRRLKRAQILLAADRGASDGEIAERVVCGMSTVTRTKRRFVEGNLELAFSEAPRSGASRKLTGKEEALLIATACSKPPAGRARWTLELLCGEMVRLTGHQSLSRETVRRRLCENQLKPWRRDMWCIPKVDAAFVAAMEDVLDLYNDTPDPGRPVICFDESPTQLIGEDPDTGAGPAGATPAHRLRIPAKRHRQPLRLPQRAPALAQGQGHRAPHRDRLRRLHAGSL